MLLAYKPSLKIAMYHIRRIGWSDQVHQSIGSGASVPEPVRQILTRNHSIEDEAAADFASFFFRS
jgi:hypothetical protein